MGDFNAYHNSSGDFDKSFNRTKKFVWVVMIMQLLFVLACIVGIVFGAIWLVKSINDKGLKAGIERVWNGPTNTPSENKVRQ